MRYALLIAFLFLPACRQAPQTAHVTEAKAACQSMRFEDTPFTVCAAGKGPVQIIGGVHPGEPRTFAALQAKLGTAASDVAFAMNAGMFDEQGQAIGLLVEDGNQRHAVNSRNGAGNFHLKPNGVFLLRRDGSADVVATDDYKPSADIVFASQSGPMLVVDGTLHPKIDADGASHFIRNGVGQCANGKALFVISDELVSFGRFARLFRDRLHCRNALYFDGSVSSLWDPANGRMDAFAELGPMVVAFRPGAASEPRPAVPAKP